ncbi:hypothetical protein D3C86_1175610 [compost metagenome]
MPTIQERILEQVALANGPICDDCLEPRAFLKQRQDANREGRKLAVKGQIVRPKERCAYCGTRKTVNVPIGHVARMEVRSNATSPAISEPAVTAKLEDLSLELRTTFSWEPVLETDGSLYCYPHLPSKEMKHKYDAPAIYRWVPYRSADGDLGHMYVGEAQSLIKRIGNYRHCSPRQQTSFRLRNLFEAYIADGVALRLERLRFDELALGSVVFTESDLSDTLVRRFIEHMMASYYRKLGWKLINAN